MKVDAAMGRVWRIDDGVQGCTACNGEDISCPECYGCGEIYTEEVADIHDIKPIHPDDPCQN